MLPLTDPALTESAAAITVAELMLAFWRHVESYYRHPDGTPTNEPNNYKYSLRPLRLLYADIPADQFTPLKLKAVRQTMIDAGLARGVINSRVSRIVRMFRWAVAEELLPETVHRALAALPALKKGRTSAHESKATRCVSDEHVLAVLPLLTRPIRAMVELQRLTGMRSGEICKLRGVVLNTTGDIWEYRPQQHKTSHHDKERVVHIGPRGQEILRPWLREDQDAYLFCPSEAMREHRNALRAIRKSPVQPSQRIRRRSAPRRGPGAKYTPGSYAYAIRRACVRAGIPLWHPHQLRHTRATEVRKSFRLEGAQVALGHSNAKITEVYAERDEELARQIAARMG
jgi:integrase